MEQVIKEAMRYTGCQDRQKLVSLFEEMKQTITPRTQWKLIPMPEWVGLSGSSAVLLAATLGADMDTLIRKTGLFDMEKALLLHGLAAAWIESLLDAMQEEVFRKTGQYTTDRISPGYGNLPLALNRFWLDQTTIGLTVNEAMMLVPEKSVTAIAGLSPVPVPQKIRGCSACKLTDCPYRKEGNPCQR